MISTWVPGGSSPSTISGSTGTWCTCTVRQRVGEHRRAARRRAARAACRSGAGRGRAGPGCGRAPSRRARRRRSPPRARPAAARAAPSPCRRSTARRAGRAPCPTARRSISSVADSLSDSSSSPRAFDRDGLDVAAADRAPGVGGADHHLGAAAARRVAAHRGQRHQHAGLARGAQAAPPRPTSAAQAWVSASVARCSERGCIGVPAGLGCGGTDVEPLRNMPVFVGRPRLLDRPVHRLGVAGEARSTLVPGGPNAAAACRSASRTAKASISGGSPTAFEP